MGIEFQIGCVLLWLVLLKFLQVSLYPVLRKVTGERAYPLSFSAGVLAFTALSWYLGLLRVPVALAAVPFLALLAWSLARGWYNGEELRAKLSWDVVFLFAFLAMLAVRVANPTITTAEKFMDHAFLASVMRSPVVPPADPWFAGGTLDIYYYGGFWIFGTLGNVTGIPSGIVFNLALPTVLALAAVNLYAIGDLLLPRLKWFPLLSFLVVNPAFVQSLFSGKPAFGILWDSTRVIAGTINEYTLFSFLWGDVHPHVLGIFNQAFLILVLFLALRRWYAGDRRERLALVALAALSLGFMPLANTWDVLVYAPVTLLVALIILLPGFRKEPRDLSALGFLLPVPVLSILLYLPYYLEMATTGILGIFRVTTPSDPVEFLLVHGFFLAIFLASGARDLARRPYLLVPSLIIAVAGYPSAALAAAAGTAVLARRDRSVEDLLALAGLGVIIWTEIFYFRDYMGAGVYYRMNTVFKLYSTAWLLLALPALIMLAGFLARFRIPRVTTASRRAALLVVSLVLLMVLPSLLSITFGYGDPSLDGLAYLGKSQPGDAAALPFVRGLPAGSVVVEGVKGDYGYASRISSFTGVPTITGWPWHEVMFRGEGAKVWERVADVRAIYEEPERAPGLLEKYHAMYLYVGNTERELYPRMSLPRDRLVRVYEGKGVTIYRFVG